MGQSIIFVGAGNLNRNRDRQAMYDIKGSGWKKEAVKNRKHFYKDLSIEAEKCPTGSKRAEAVRELMTKYEGYSCSRENIERVFLAYADCFIEKGINKTEIFHKQNLVQMLEKHKVDKRVIRKILNQEGLKSPDYDMAGPKKKSISKMKTTPKRIASSTNNPIDKQRFYRLLDSHLRALIKTKKDLPMKKELKGMFEKMNRGENDLRRLRKLYYLKNTSNMTLDEINKKYLLNMYKKDLRALSKFWS